MHALSLASLSVARWRRVNGSVTVINMAPEAVCGQMYVDCVSTLLSKSVTPAWTNCRPGCRPLHRQPRKSGANRSCRQQRMAPQRSWRWRSLRLLLVLSRRQLRRGRGFRRARRRQRRRGVLRCRRSNRRSTTAGPSGTEWVGPIPQLHPGIRLQQQVLVHTYIHVCVSC